MSKGEHTNIKLRRSIGILATGLCTGLLVGVIVTFYNIAATFITNYSANLYEGILANPGFIPLLFAVLALAGFAVGVVVHFLPMIRGSGIPQTEGASRGLIRMKWYQVLPAMTAASLFTMFCGLTAGAEGPSMFIGGSCGSAVSNILGGTDMEKRYQITGGACAGLAVAFNAPLSGIVFAFEEAHRRFTPSIFICAFSSVLTALITRNLLFTALGMQATSVFTTYAFATIPIKSYLYVALSAIISGLFGVLFYKFGFLLRKLFAKMTILKGALRMVIPFIFAGVAGLITVYTIGGGHSLIQGIGTQGGVVDMAIKSVFSTPVIATLVIVLVLRFFSTSLNLGTGVPCGLFIPMLALGAVIGALTSRMCVVIGMDKALVDCIVMIAMATFFTTVVKSPITAIIMVVELTWQFTLLLPVILGVAIGYMLSEIFKMQPLYDELLDSIMEEAHVTLSRQTYVTEIEEGAVAVGVAIRDVLWPGNLLIRSVSRDGAVIVPNSDTVLHAGDEITVQAETTSLDDLITCVNEIVKSNHGSIFQKLFNKLKSALAKRKSSSNAGDDSVSDVSSASNDNVDSDTTSTSENPVQTADDSAISNSPADSDIAPSDDTNCEERKD